MPIDVNLCEELIAYAASGDLENVRKLSVRDDVDVNYSPWVDKAQVIEYSGTALYHAIENKQQEVAEFLVQSPDLEIDAYDFPLSLRSGSQVNLNALCHAINKNLPGIAIGLLDRGACISPPCTTEIYGTMSNALGHAIVAHEQELVARMAGIWIKEKGTEFDFAENMPVIHCAIRFSSIGILKTLLQHGADPNEVDTRSHTTPLEFAIKEAREYPHPEVFDATAFYKVLLEGGANISFKEYLQMNPELADFISSNQLPEKMSSLLHDGIDINFKGVLDITPLMLAAANNDFMMMGEMVKKGADITIVNKFGKTAFDMDLQGVKAQAVHDEKSISSMADSDMHQLINAQVRTRSTDEDDMAYTRPYAEMQDDAYELVQLHNDENLPSEQNTLTNVASVELVQDEEASPIELDCIFDPSAMNYHGI